MNNLIALIIQIKCYIFQEEKLIICLIMPNVNKVLRLLQKWKKIGNMYRVLIIVSISVNLQDLVWRLWRTLRQ